ncbi:MAG TPA: DegT/DnrJ/EryC1/StrS family aminotransferase [Actinoplanes sp.]|nr:DegT/DnrJ/EryC1/StrS family aminotransferase [Actinoplanes sp.]
MSSRLAFLGGEPVVGQVPPVDWPNITESDIGTVVQLLKRGEISYNGREGQVRDLEDRYRADLGISYALATNSGTSALHSAFFGIGLEPGDEVLVPTYTFLATAMPLFVVNAVPVLVDVDPLTGNLNPSALAAARTERTKAIVVTHLNGYPVDMAQVMRFAEEHSLVVVEDCSQAHGAYCDGRPVGTFGVAAAFSMQAKKLVSGGSAGILVTDDSLVYQRAVLLGHNLDRSAEAVTSPEYRPYIGTAYGLNLRLNPLLAALANGSYDRLEQTIAARALNYDHLDAVLADVPGLRPPVVQPHMTRAVHYSYQPLYRPEEIGGLPLDAFVRAVAAEGVPLVRPTSPPLHREPAFRTADPGLRTYGHFGRNPNGYRVHGDDYPGAEAYLAHALRLPVYTADARSVLDGFAAGIRKVVEHADELAETLQLASS